VTERSHHTLSRADLEPTPMAQFRRWLDDAETAAITMPNAMALATSDAEGRPSVRHVLLRNHDDRGFVFFTNYESRKARQLAENPHAAIVFLWKELDRQVSASGPVERVTRQESEAYFRTRPREAQFGAWASRQSEVLSNREELERRYTEIDERYRGSDVPLPPHWGGFRLLPDTVEFWQGRDFRLHDRFRFSAGGEAGGWRIERLSP
jgi:pyridoxamine 5'-phosphate oxidase